MFGLCILDPNKTPLATCKAKYWSKRRKGIRYSWWWPHNLSYKLINKIHLNISCRGNTEINICDVCRICEIMSTWKQKLISRQENPKLLNKYRETSQFGHFLKVGTVQHKRSCWVSLSVKKVKKSINKWQIIH